MVDLDAVKARHTEADGLASNLHANQGKRDIRASLDDIPILLERLVEVRAVLERLLDDAVEYIGDGYLCRLCKERGWHPTRLHHAPTCPVRRYALLGRVDRTTNRA